jgi:putative hydrolase of the HAD superfamily
MKTYKAVFFDAGNTLLYTSPTVAEIYHAVAKDYGCLVSVDEIRQASRKVFLEFSTALLKENQDHRHSDEEDRRRWAEMIRSTFQQIGFDEGMDEITEKLFQAFKDPKIWRLFPEVIGVLSELKSQGYKLAIVSNWSSVLLNLSNALKIEPYMDATMVSAVVGWAKPSPVIFQKALDSIEVSPGEAIHVGDSYHDDILGAKSAGIDAVLIDRLDMTTHACSRIKDLREIYSLLGNYSALTP